MGKDSITHLYREKRAWNLLRTENEPSKCVAETRQSVFPHTFSKRISSSGDEIRGFLANKIKWLDRVSNEFEWYFIVFGNQMTHENYWNKEDVLLEK